MAGAGESRERKTAERICVRSPERPSFFPSILLLQMVLEDLAESTDSRARVG